MSDSKHPFANVKPSPSDTPKAVDHKPLAPVSDGNNYVPCIDCGEETIFRCGKCQTTPICAACPDVHSDHICPDCSLSPEDLAYARLHFGARWWAWTGNEKAA